jgi:alanine dehydrogenase
MALLLTENDVRDLLDMPLAMELVEASFQRLADRSGISQPRRRVKLGQKGLMHYMAAADQADGYAGLKIYTVANRKARFIVPLFKVETGDLLALIEADYLGQMRTGAATGVGTKFMARSDARIAGLIGTGLQARTQLEAMCRARKFEEIRVFGRDQARREAFALAMAAKVRVPVVPVSSAEDAVRGADVVTTCTNSVNPVAEADWFESGVHINAAGVNFAHKRELDAETVDRCDVIAADSVEDAKIESGELIAAFGDDTSEWARVIELADVVAGKIPGRTSPDQITLFKSNGIAIEDVVVAGRIFEVAQKRGIGREVEIWKEKDPAA